MIGIGFDMRSIVEDVLPEIDGLNIENPQIPNYLNGDYPADIRHFLQKNYGKKIITDGAYIDLNPAAAEIEILETVKKKVRQSIDFANAIGSDEVIFLSTYLPMIRLGFYDQSFVENAVRFWREIMPSSGRVRVSLCNTFEYDPALLVAIANGVCHERFGLAFDIGHAYAYGTPALPEFFRQMEPFCQSVYIHSNNQAGDEHLNLFEGTLWKSRPCRELLPQLGGRNILLKPFDKSRLPENLRLLKSALAL